MKILTDNGHIRAMIVDDEVHARENLRWMLEEYVPEVKVVATAEGVDSAYDAFVKTRPDVIFLDIRMPSGAEGFDLLDRLQGRSFHVVFVTAFKEYAIRAFEKRALHYILKPIDEEDLRETVDRLLARRESDAHSDEAARAYRQALQSLRGEIDAGRRPEKLAIHHGKGIKIIDLDDVEFLESEGNCTRLHFRSGDDYLDTRTLKVYEALLPSGFFRLHRSYIIHLNRVTEVLHGDDQEVVLSSGRRLPIARVRKREFLERIKALTSARDAR